MAQAPDVTAQARRCSSHRSHATRLRLAPWVPGRPRMHAELKEQGWRCSRKRMAQLLQENGMSAKRKRRHPITTRSNPGHGVAPNLLLQDCTAQRPNPKWTGDIPSIPTAEGWLYLAVILDLSSRMVHVVPR